MKKFLFYFMMFVIIIAACGQPKNYGSESMYNEYECWVSHTQLDSICVADTLGNIDDWLKSAIVEYESQTPIYEYMYIKELNDSITFIYTVHMVNDSIRIAKRVTDDK